MLVMKRRGVAPTTSLSKCSHRLLKEAITPDHVRGDCTSEDFPEPGDQSYFVWNQSIQHMELAEVREWYEPEDPPDYASSADLDFLLEREFWTLEVPDVLDWQAVSQYENPEYRSPNWRGGNRYVAGPAQATFLRYVHGQTPNRLYPPGLIPPWGIDLVGKIQGTRVNGVDHLGRVVLRPWLRHLGTG